MMEIEEPLMAFLEPRDRMDAAILGMIYLPERGQRVLVYRVESILEIFREDGMNHAEAREFFEHNTAAAYIGPGTPLFMDEFDGIDDE